MTKPVSRWCSATMTSEETVRKRLQVYHQQTSPLVDFYRNFKGETAPRYHRVEGVGSVEEIRNSVLSSLKN